MTLNVIPRLVVLSPSSFDLHVQFVEVLWIYAVFGGKWLVKCEIGIKIFIGFLLVLFGREGLRLLMGLVVGGIRCDVYQLL